MDKTGSNIRVVDPTFPVRRPEGLQLYLEETAARVFPCVYCKIFKSIYYEEYLGTTSKTLRWVFLNIFSFCFVLFWFFGGFLMKISGSSSDKDQSGIQSSLYNNMKRQREIIKFQKRRITHFVIVNFVA